MVEAIGKLPAARACVERRGIRAVLPVAFLLCGAVSAARAQQSCLAATRDLTSATAPARAAALRGPDAVTSHADVIADAVTCADSRPALITRRLVARARDTVRIALHFPEVSISASGGVPGWDDRAGAWGGRGLSVFGTAGVSVDTRVAHLMLAPSLWWSENRSYDLIVSRDASRNAFASPFYTGDSSVDLPSRFGASPLSAVDPYASALWLNVKWVDAGVATSPQAWGPGLRQHLLLGPNAPGIPRIFARTARPLLTRAGMVSATGFAGVLTESRFFDSDPANDTRELIAWTAALSPDAEGHVTVGVSHAVLLGVGANQANDERSVEQMLTLSAQLRSPADGFRAWVEVGRSGGLPPMRRLITTPYLGLGYVMGVEYAARLSRSAILRSAEAVNVEQPTDIREVPSRDFYTSTAIPQGWTQRGHVLGVSTGPGSQSQYVAVDWVAGRWSAGIFGERVRWNEDALFREYLPYQNRHDVSLRAGTRVSVQLFGYETALQLSSGKRLNYLFQNGAFIPGFRTVDVPTPQLRLTFNPFSRS